MSANFQRDLQIGERFQDHVLRSLWRAGILAWCYGSKPFQLNRGEGMALEVKRDDVWPSTKALYIEYQAKGMGGWNPSGIYRGDETWLLAQGNEEKFWLFSQKHLKNAIHMAIQRKEIRTVEARRPGDVKSDGYRIPLHLAERISIHIFRNGEPVSHEPESLVCERCHNRTIELKGGLCAECEKKTEETVA